MRVGVGDIALFVEVIGAKLAVSDGSVSQRPTIIFLHGGPAWDHLALRPCYQPLADIAQLIFYDHRGLGRSDRADRETWTLAHWSEDLEQLIHRLGLDRPIIFGQSFGGIVAQRFAIDNPNDYSGLILAATAARFDLEGVVATFQRLGGDRLAQVARSFFTASNPEEREQFLKDGMPFYTVSDSVIGALSEFHPHVLDHFFSREGEAHSFDFRSELASLWAPTLILGGDSDPVMPPAAVMEMADAFTTGVATTHILRDCGHGPARDKPEQALRFMRDFVACCHASSDHD